MSKIEIENFNLGTFNVRGLKFDSKKEQLASDLHKYKLHVICLQETKINEDLDKYLNNARLINFKPKCKYYGMGFIINKNIEENIVQCEYINDRICFIEFEVKKGMNIIIINVYGPTQNKTTKDPELRDALYKEMEKIIAQKKKEGKGKHIILLAGDFNSKVGMNPKEDENSIKDNCLGNYSRGSRNENGQALIDFCEKHNFYITNTHFRHSARHRTTWLQTRNTIQDTTKTLVCMIDFIICQHRHRNFFNDSRSHGGTQLISDHKLVKAKTTFKWHKQKRIRKNNKFQIERDNIKGNEDKYKETLIDRLTHLPNEYSGQQLWKKTKDAIISTMIYLKGGE